MKRVRKAVLPVAGLGTRVLPGAKTTPKEMLNIFDRPILSYIVAEARAAGIEHFVFVTGRGKNAIEDYFDHHPELESQLEAKAKTAMLEEIRAELPKPGEMSFVRQMAPLGLGHAVWCARDIVGDEPFAVMLPDMLMDAQPPALAILQGHDSVLVRLALRGGLDHHDVAAQPVMGLDRLGERRLVGGHQHVGQHDREGLVADDVARAPDRVAQP